MVLELNFYFDECLEIKGVINFDLSISKIFEKLKVETLQIIYCFLPLIFIFLSQLQNMILTSFI